MAYNGHVNELFELPVEERNAFMDDVCKVAETIQKVFSPEKINYGAYSDKLPHLHFHIVPKYVDGYTFGSTFEMNPQKVYLTDEEYAAIIELLVNAL